MGDEYGERRLLRSLLQAADGDAEGIRGQLVERAQAFYARPEQDDDITLVVVKRRRVAAAVSPPGGPEPAGDATPTRMAG